MLAIKVFVRVQSNTVIFFYFFLRAGGGGDKRYIGVIVNEQPCEQYRTFAGSGVNFKKLKHFDCTY